jgi:hypothetical protein
MRLEGWAAPWFETHSFGALLTMRPYPAIPFCTASHTFDGVAGISM